MPKGYWQFNKGAQEEALMCPEKEILYGGARGGGKTEAGLAWLAEPEYITRPNYRSLVIRQDYMDLSDWIMRARDFYSGLNVRIVGNPAVIKWPDGGETRLGHWKDPATISKYIGHEYWKILLEELTQSIKSLQEYKMILGSCRCSEEDLEAQMFATTNPGGPGNAWVKKYWIEIPVIRKCEICKGEGCNSCQEGWIETGEKTTSKNQTYVDPKTGYDRIFIPAKVSDNPKIDRSYKHWLNGLPEPLRSMWKDGSWEVYEGQFFIDFGVSEEPFEIPERDVRGMLYGSLDGGVTKEHPTSFGLWWVSNKWNESRFGRENTIHRIFTYKGEGGTHKGHAREIFDRLESCVYTKGHFPKIIFYDDGMNTRTRNDEYNIRAPINEYEDVWMEGSKQSIFKTANKNKKNGCDLMRMLYKVENNAPWVYYFGNSNRDYVDGMMLVQTDKNNTDVYAKMEGDDIADECRYGLVGIYSDIKGYENNSMLTSYLRYNKQNAQRNADWY